MIKFEIGSQELIDVVENVAVSLNPSKPVIRFSIKQQKIENRNLMELTSYDGMEMQITDHCFIKTRSEKEEVFNVDGKLILDSIKAFSRVSDVLKFSIDDKQIDIITNVGVQHLPKADDAIIMDAIHNDILSMFSINSNELHNGLLSGGYMYGANPELKGVFFKYSQDGLTIRSIDGSYGSSAEVKTLEQEDATICNFFMPTTVLSLKKIIKKNTKVDILVQEKLIIFKADNLFVFINKLSVNFKDSIFEKLISLKSDIKASIIISKKDILNAMDVIRISCDKQPIMKVNNDNGKIELSSVNNQAKIIVDAKANGDFNEIQLRLDFVQMIMDKISNETVIISIINGISPLFISPYIKDKDEIVDFNSFFYLMAIAPK